MVKVKIKFLDETKEEFWARHVSGSLNEGRIIYWDVNIDKGNTKSMFRSYPVNVIFSVEEIEN